MNGHLLENTAPFFLVGTDGELGALLLGGEGSVSMYASVVCVCEWMDDDGSIRLQHRF